MYKSKILNVTLILSGLCMAVSGCGGSGGKDSDPSLTDSSGGTTSPPSWMDTGNLGNSIVFLTKNIDGNYQEIQKFDETGTVISLTKEMVDGAKVATIKVSPDGKKIGYLADQVTDNKYELFVVNTDGSANLKVSADISGGDITEFEWAPDSNNIIYKYSLNFTDSDYYLVSFDGISPTKIEYADSFGEEFKIESVEFLNGGLEYGVIASSQTNYRALVFNVSTGTELRNIISTDIMLKGDWSYDGHYYSYITDINSDKQIINLDTFSGLSEQVYQARNLGLNWSPVSSELAFYDFDELFVYNPTLGTSLSVSNFGGVSPNSLSWLQLWNDNGKFIVIEASPSFGNDELVISRADGVSTLLSSQLLGTTDEVNKYSVSSSDTVALLSDGGRLVTASLDGTNVIDFSFPDLLSSNIRSFAWAANYKSLVVMHYNADINGNSISQFDTSTRIASKVSGNRDVVCFVVADSSKSTCRLFFDER